MGGQIDAAVTAFVPQIETMKILGVTSSQRLKALPNVPTFRENGLDIILGLSTSVAAPAGTPPAIVAKINAAVNEFLNGPRRLGLSNDLGLQIIGGSPSDMRGFLEQESARLEPVIKAANITMD
jgi:tripartite-type tricarboxylate transporter receptor subunit TctC